jgi:HEAT repeat protein
MTINKMNIQISKHLVQLLSATLIVTLASVSLGQAVKPSPKSESELIAILRSDQPEAEKAIACKYLSVYGGDAAVPELAKLLSNEHLASWSRTALEAIPGPVADEALRKASESLQGLLLVGTINSIGIRRDAAAVDLLAKRLEDKNDEVAAAAAVALGKIGTPAAAPLVRKALAGGSMKVRNAAAEGCILCAEQFLASGKGAEAAQIYEDVRKAEVPRPRMLEATRGVILARGKEGIPLLVEQLRSNDEGLYQIALFTARELPGNEIDKALAAELEKLFPERAALVVATMADRTKTVDLAAVLKAASAGHKQVRLAAIEAVGRVGNATCVAPLLQVAAESDAELAKAAKESLVALPGAAVDKDLAGRLGQAEGKTYPVLIEVVGQRRIDATAALLKALTHSDRTVRNAALMALGNTVSEKYLGVLVKEVVSPASADNADVAKLALKTAAVRMPDREACAAELSSALDKSPVPTTIVLLDILAAVGGTKALAAVGAAGKSPDAALQDASSELLGKWMTPDAGPVLLELAKRSDNKFQGRSFRGYIRVARQMAMPEPQRVEMCKNALEATRKPEEQKLVLVVLKQYPSVEMLRLAVKAAQMPELKDDGKEAVKAIADKLPKNNDEVKKLLSQVGL